MEHYKMYVNGEWRDSEVKQPVYNKYTREQTATYAKTSGAEVDEAIAAARESFNTVKLTPSQRAEILTKAKAFLLEEKDAIANAICNESGRLIGDSMGEVGRSALVFDLAAEEGKRICGEMIPVDGVAGGENKVCFTLRAPVGVVCAITPFNVPLSLTMHKVAPAIAAGNTVILKPSEASPGFAVKLVEIFLKAGLPKNHIQLVLGGGASVGEALLNNEGIDFYTFTGSVSTGEHIKKTIGLRRCSMELGSNAPVIVHSDAADVKKAAVNCALKGFMNAGQVCMKPQRILVQESVLDEFLEAAAEFAKGLVTGDPRDPKTNIGPLISAEEADRVDNWVKEAVAQGARVVAGGEKASDVCYAPTVLTDVKKGMRVVDEEIFGPVIVVIPYGEFDEAIRIANDSVFGLQAGVFTANINLAMKAAREIEAGGVIINETSFWRVDNMPYGGIKRSSAGGKEGPRFAIKEMTNLKTILIEL